MPITSVQHKEKWEHAKKNYNALNDELLRDMPALFEDRIPFFDPVFATVTFCEFQLLSVAVAH
jgi:hypothetical protein